MTPGTAMVELKKFAALSYSDGLPGSFSLIGPGGTIGPRTDSFAGWTNFASTWVGQTFSTAPPNTVIPGLQLAPSGYKSIINGQLLPWFTGVYGDSQAAQKILMATDVPTPAAAMDMTNFAKYALTYQPFNATGLSIPNQAPGVSLWIGWGLDAAECQAACRYAIVRTY